MKILWYSNTPWGATAYSSQTRHVVAGLQAAGHEMAVHANWGLEGGVINAGPTRVYPRNQDTWGMDVIDLHAAHFGAELIITLYDIWPFPVDIATKLKTPWCPWFPIDCQPPNPATIQRARTADYPVVLSRFAQDELERYGIQTTLIPHGVDTEIYKPMDKAAVRRALKLPTDAFIVLMVARNSGTRKSFPENLQAFARFHEKHPDSVLYLHTTAKPRTQDGVEIDLIADALGIGRAVRFTDEYRMVLGINEETIAMIFNSADVLLAGSRGEGFGVPIIESQSCGVPVITTQFGPMPELTVNGYSVKPLQRDWAFLDSWWAMPSVDGMVEALEAIYNQTEDERAFTSDAGRRQMIQEYSWPVINRQWVMLLDAIAEGRVRPVMESLRRHEINGIEIETYDDALSFTTEAVAQELRTDSYDLNRVEFKTGDIVVDIGGHVGLFAMYVKKRWPDVQVISIEPSSVNCERFKRNCEHNGVDGIKIIHCALTADGRPLNLLHNRGNTGGDTAFSRPNGHEVEVVNSTSLDQIFSECGIEQCRLLKIDCEGAEHEILKSTRVLTRVDYLAGEFHENATLAEMGHTAAGLYRYLRETIPASRITYNSCPIPD